MHALPHSESTREKIRQRTRSHHERVRRALVLLDAWERGLLVAANPAALNHSLQALHIADSLNTTVQR
jgi:hypothetical protein